MGWRGLPGRVPVWRKWGGLAAITAFSATASLLVAGCVTTGTTVSPTVQATAAAERRRVSPSVSNVSFRQEGTGVVIPYDLAADEPCPVALRASPDGG